MAAGARFECLDEQTLAALIDGRLDWGVHSGVEAHLAECSDCRGLIAAAATGIPDSVSPGESEALADIPQPGQVLAGKYRVEALLGRGGMGVVLAARHLELGQNVAIKMLRSAAPLAAARFLREAKTSAQLVDEHIARVFDLGRLPNGTPFIVMEHLVGEDLSRVIARGPVSASVAVDYALQVCQALAVAHRAGVVHRDLKPGNLFLTRRAEDGSPWLKVLDFGISKRLERSPGDESQSLTATASVLGSPVYMSPEQIRASKGVDARTDIWSLGVVLFELTTGQRPFKAPTLAALAVAIATEAVPAPSSLRSSVPAWLDAVIARCLSKEPGARFGSVRELADALRAGALPESRASSVALAAAVTRPRRLRGLLLVGCAASTALGLVWLTGRARRPSAEQPVSTASALLAGAAVELRAAPPALKVQCELPLPAGNVRLFSRAVAPERSAGERVVDAAELCRAGAAGASVELRALLGDPATLARAELEPPQPFYSIEVQTSASRTTLELKRAARLAVRLRLLGADCGTLRSIAVVPAGLARIPARTARAEGSPQRAGTTAECSAGVELPFEAFGKPLRIEIAAPGFLAPEVSFSSGELELKLRAAPKKPAAAQPAERCVPPHYHNCRE